MSWPRRHLDLQELDLAVDVRGQQAVGDPLGLEVVELAALVVAYDDPAAEAVGLPVGLGAAREEGGDRDAEDPGDVAQCGDRRARLSALDLGQQAARDADGGGELLEGEAPCLPEGPDVPPELERLGADPASVAALRRRHEGTSSYWQRFDLELPGFADGLAGRAPWAYEAFLAFAGSAVLHGHLDRLTRELV